MPSNIIFTYLTYRLEKGSQLAEALDEGMHALMHSYLFIAVKKDPLTVDLSTSKFVCFLISEFQKIKEMADVEKKVRRLCWLSMHIGRGRVKSWINVSFPWMNRCSG